MGFTLECIVVNHLSIALSSCPGLGFFSVCHSKMSFTLPLHTTNDYHWSLSFVTSKVIDEAVLYKDIMSPQLSPLSCLLFVSSLWGIVKVTCCLLPVVPCLFICMSFKVYSNIYPTRCNVTHFVISGNYSTCFRWCINTRCYRYSCMHSWWWVEVPPKHVEQFPNIINC
jgi:hypothetical protein